MAFTVDFTVYNFQVAHNERRWFVQKRYSQFDKLDSTLNEKFPDVMISVQRLPPKKPFGSLSPALIAMRQKSLDAYLQGILMRPLLARSEEVRDFIEMPLDVREMDREEQRHLQAAKDALARDFSSPRHARWHASCDGDLETRASTRHLHNTVCGVTTCARVMWWSTRALLCAAKNRLLHRAGCCPQKLVIVESTCASGISVVGAGDGQVRVARTRIFVRNDIRADGRSLELLSSASLLDLGACCCAPPCVLPPSIAAAALPAPAEATVAVCAPEGERAWIPAHAKQLLLALLALLVASCMGILRKFGDMMGLLVVKYR
eukprot:CAMPEP_0181318072 /NCGR_PEP_ID=MMETSP1101-20121128/16811_1 /TAXON_ID=46948 /ORGANISM="Rhodomonas abbreviata, Strain Caron Lab Isolate" /LENGTH=318 /DNA_ID=CAMNT_0023425517 /DNA_START=225 /DNA_END=1178 /DNA_ORIENTATION=+